MRVLVLHVMRYDMSEQNGPKGCKLDILQVEEASKSDNSFGVKPTTMDAEPEVFDQIKPGQVPGYFDLGFRFKTATSKAAKTLMVPVATTALFAAPVVLAPREAAKA